MKSLSRAVARWLGDGSGDRSKHERGSQEPPLESGYMDVGDGHELYFEQWGAPEGVPVMVLHGGPGGSFNATFKNLFSADKHRLVLFDQRGCGRSKPAGRIANNTTTDLIGDINRLRARVGLAGATNFAGGSWGSTLALVYAEHYPENVKELMLWSTFLATSQVIYEPLGVQPQDRHFPHPRAWWQFVRLIPRAFKSDPKKIIDYSLSVFNSMDAAKARELAVAYTVYDYATCNSPSFNEAQVRAEAEADPNVVHGARIQMHYFKNGCFLAENEIIDGLARIRGIKANVVHGLDDWCTKPKVSDDLEIAYGKNMALRRVKSGHLRSDPEMTKALRLVANQLS